MAEITTTFATAWVPPPVIVGFSGTVDELMSSIILNWAPSGLSDAEFDSYKISRREFGTSVWEIIVVINTKATSTYADYSAGQTLVYEYKINQFKKITGDVPLSSDDSDIVTAGLTGDSWFLIGLLSGAYSPIELVVTTEEHTTVIQQEVFEPLAGTRKRIVRGLMLGDEGSFTALFDSSISRATKVFFETLSATPGPHLLKSAFGDVWIAEFDAPAFKYTTGGHLSITIGWVEV